jgi:hypothetical protein
MKKRNMLKAIRILRSAVQRKDDQIDRLEAEIAEYREIFEGIDGTIDDLPYWEMADGVPVIEEDAISTNFQWFRSWLTRNGLREALNPSQQHLETPKEKYQREIREQGLCDNLSAYLFDENGQPCSWYYPDDKPRLDGHFDGEGYHPDEDR